MNTLAISVGDPAGIGPEVAVRAALQRRGEARIFLFGDAVDLEARVVAEGGSLRPLSAGDRVGLTLVDVGRVSQQARTSRGPTAEGGAAQLRALEAALAHVRAAPRTSALVTGPVSKEAARFVKPDFVGHTEYLARAVGQADDSVTMLFLGTRLRVALATTHLSLADVPTALTQARVERTTSHLRDALARIGMAEPRLAICGVNPHASDGGAFGNEEMRVIEPALKRAAKRGSGELIGPIGAETAFRWAAAGTVDGVVAMFHDQATIASKILDFGQAVNVTWGLPFVRTSVDHGVAYDAAGTGNASSGGMEAALDLAIRLLS